MKTKYVIHMNEEWYNDLISDYETAFQDLFDKLFWYNENCDASTSRIESTPVFDKKGNKQPFPLAARLYPIYQWLVGEKKKPEDFDETMNIIMNLVWFNPFIDYSELMEYDTQWERWTGHTGAYTGQFYRYAMIASNLENGESINATDLALLLNVTTMAISKQIKANKILATKESNQWVITAEEALRVIKNKSYVASENK